MRAWRRTIRTGARRNDTVRAELSHREMRRAIPIVHGPFGRTAIDHHARDAVFVDEPDSLRVVNADRGLKTLLREVTKRVGG